MTSGANVVSMCQYHGSCFSESEIRPGSKRNEINSSKEAFVKSHLNRLFHRESITLTSQKRCQVPLNGIIVNLESTALVKSKQLFNSVVRILLHNGVGRFYFLLQHITNRGIDGSPWGPQRRTFDLPDLRILSGPCATGYLVLETR